MNSKNFGKLLIEELEKRELIAKSTEKSSLIALLNNSISFYCGFDPTGESLHVGHLLLIVLIKHLQKFGHRPILVIGGATGRIGDPSFKTAERDLTSLSQLDHCAQSLKVQFEQLFDFYSTQNAAKFCNNFEWTQTLDTITFLREIGKHFSVNNMLKKEAIKQRIERAEVGISYAEFSYALLQAYDFLHLYRSENAMLQLGGSDQWGNIVAGINLISAKEHQEVHALTVPLITKSDGSKFGKTESGAVWLSAEKTSPYDFYQFWINTNDDVVLPYLKKFTFIPLETLETYNDLSQHAPNAAQKVLAYSMTAWIHGATIAKNIEKINKELFEGNISTLSKESLEMISTLPKVEASERYSLLKALKETNLCASIKEGKRQIDQGAIYINDYRVENSDDLQASLHRLHNGYTILRRGKKNYALIKWMS